jgi:hypothetical protein
MKTIYVTFFVVGILSMIVKPTIGEEYVLEQSQTYLTALKQIADKMEVFPIDLISRQGQLSNFIDGESRSKIAIRLELTSENFRYFYDFCELALRATEEDIEVCIDKIKSASPKEQSLILTVIYVYSFPWSKEKPFVSSENQEELKKYWDFRNSGGEDIAFYVLLGCRSWLGMNYHNFDTKNRPTCDEVIRSKYKKIVEKFIDDPQIAFSAITITPPKRERRVHERINISELLPKSIRDKRKEFSYYDFENISSRKEKLDLLKKNYPEEHQQIISDIFFLLYVNDTCNIRTPLGFPPNGNASATPKTVGQIAQQLIDSWEPMKQVLPKEKKIKASPFELFKIVPLENL